MQGVEGYYHNQCSQQSKAYSSWSDTSTWNQDYQGNGSGTSPLGSVATHETETSKSLANDLESDDVSRDKEDHESNQKHSQIAATLRWLNENYERSEGVCLPRCVLYTHYLDFCKKLVFHPAGAATFGKIIRQRFPKLTTRRLGTRGQSKYHYYGIGVKETSIYYHSVYSGKGLTRFSGTKVKTEGSNRKYSLSSKTGTLLPDFPNAENLILPEIMDTEKMKTFLMMYRTHCQRILDTVIAANFEEVESFLLHFWQGMPDHLVDLFDSAITSDVIALCDYILYKVLIDVLIPTSIQDLPESLGSEISMFIDNLPIWLKTSMENTPVHIQRVKNEVSRIFTQSIKRHLSFIHLAQTARGVLSNTDSVSNMTEDMAEINLTEISRQATFLHPSLSKEGEVIFNAFEEFQSLLNRQVSIEAYTEWMDELIDKCVLQFPINKNGGFYESKAADFLLHWTLIGSLMMRDLTLNSASSFGSFHLLHMMLDEYAFLVLETQNDLIREQALQSNLQKHMKNAEVIKMVARVRTVCQSNATTKCKKRKLDSPDFSDVHDVPPDINFNDNSDSSDVLRKGNMGTLERYSPSEGNRKNTPNCYSREYNRSLNHSSDSSFYPYQSLPNSVYDKAYMTHLNGNYSYQEYRSNCPSLTPHQLPPSYSDSSGHHHGQNYHSLPSLARSISPMTSTYWTPTDPRSFPIHHQDTYNQLTHSSRFDACKKSGYFRSGFYETVGPTFPVSALESSQYVIQDPPLYQDDCYHHHANLPTNISAYPPLSKTFFSQTY